ncbi:MAG: DNA polymerase I [Thermoanaerobaculia bacterium]
MTNKRGTLILVDGSSNIYRAYYAIRGLTNSSGLSTNAVYGFIQMLRKMLKEKKPDAVAVAFDVSKKTFRHQQFEDYKKDRKPMPDDLVAQLPFIREVCEGFGLSILEREEYEADDLIGSVACQARDRGWDVVIATADKDFFQLVGDGISLYHTGREVIYDAAGVKEVFGLEPAKVVDVMAIWGDAIDNIPGVPGIGEKGAKALISEFGSLDALYENLDKVKKPAQRKTLYENLDKAYLSRDLATIQCGMTIDLDLDELRLAPPDRGKLHELFARLEFQSLMQEFLPDAPSTAPAREYTVVKTAEELRAALASAERIAMHFEPEQEGFGAPVAAAFSVRPGEAILVPLDPILGSTPQLVDEIRTLLSSARRFAAHDAKALIRRLSAGGLPVPDEIADTMIQSYVLNPGAYVHSLESLVRERLAVDVMSRKEATKLSGTISLDQPCCHFLGEKADLTLRLLELLEPQLEADSALLDVYRRIEMPLIPVLAAMEERGIRIDVDFLRAMSKTMGEQIASLETRIYSAAGQEFNINSPTQLSFILFEKLGYPSLKKTQKTKSASTGVEVLSQLAALGHEVPQLILEHRELHKLKSTYVDALPELVAKDGRVHTTFNQAVAATGRLSSSDPNLQNIPVRTAQGREIRRAFVADEGNVILAADYSQIELRVLAHMTGDEALREAFERGADIHRATAARIFGVSEALVLPEQRRASKTINFGVLYGMSAFRLSQDLGISGSEAKEFIESYFARYPKIRAYLDATLEGARESGKVTTLFGRVRYIPEIRNKSFTIRGNAERMATNAPIQGTAADLLKLAMIALDARLRESAPHAAMLLTVHDEIVLEVPSGEVEAVEALVRSTMESVYPLAVPLAVETHWGRSWFDAKG